ncbi:cdc42 effector protein 5 [Sphaerodactylus townsendi]|uniref:cdc42 effector protein 5 n=1 Tax=Sphaerodactylus townsendi TaxID=933632 RepID=UPI0020262C47|nr:cdc42 effector protein 5 [Sphaerodactylus townsendi]XP_048374060.1 cdc42 effector protein 5 [Sphaerodactylus townsendi]XP_048374061.1 cdc42 effector protein 5 [Sphaerodactylus townsendi]XP_048374063.1 cdc42 effector protein 5 [Sphaerodactylus townsendi]
MPILKQSPVSHSKKRPRLDRAMISAPLGDFRHTMHIGRGGDAFGDTSFLSNHGGSKANGLASEVSGSPDHLSVSGADSGHFELLSPPGKGGNGVIQSPATSTPDGSYVVMEDQQPQVAHEDASWNLHQKISLESPALEYGESFLSFQLDLGPSILDEVLGVMDKDWDSIKDLDQGPLRTESLSPVGHHLHHAVDDEDDEGGKMTMRRTWGSHTALRG